MAEKFRNAAGCLMWAAGVSASDIVKAPSIHFMRGRENLRGALSQEKHAQAALIRVMASRLNAIEYSYLVLAYWMPLLRSANARKRYHETRSTGRIGEVKMMVLRTEADYEPYFGEVIRYLMGRLGGMQNYRALRKMILNQMGERVGIHAIRRDMRCSMARAIEVRRMVNDYLADLHKIALGKLEEMLRAADLVGEE